MNVEDITVNKNELTVEDKLTAIFEHQHKLAKKYGHIELKSGLVQTTDFPVDINSAKGQARLKDFAWRVTEELTEATECLVSTTMKMISISVPHFQEELIDALHFLVEMNLLSDNYPIANKFSNDCDLNWLFEMNPCPNYLGSFSLHNEYRQKIIRTQTYRVVESLGKAMNCLKNKPWKQTHIPTDEQKFRGYMREAFHNFIGVLSMSGLTSQTAFELYIHKKEVNKFRQGSGY